MAVPSSQILSFGPEVGDLPGRDQRRSAAKGATRACTGSDKKEGVAAAILAGPDFRYTTGLRTPMFIGHGAEQFAVVFANSDETVVFQQFQHAKQNRTHEQWDQGRIEVKFIVEGVTNSAAGTCFLDQA